MSRRNIKPTTFHDDSRSSDAGSVVAAPRSKPRAKDPAKEQVPVRDNRALEPQVNGLANTVSKLPFLGPDGEVQVDFNALPIDALQKYKHHYNITLPDAPPPQKSKTGRGVGGKKRPHEDSDDEVSNSEDDSPYRIDLGAWRPRINKSELAKAVRTHFNNLPPARENDVIVQFLYSIKTQDKVLRARPDN